MQDAPEGPAAIAFPDSLILNILLRRLYETIKDSPKKAGS